MIKISEELGMPIPKLDTIWSKADYQCYVFNYYPIDGYVPKSMVDGVKMEVALMSKAFPTDRANVDSYIYQFLMKDNMDIVKEYGLEPFEMNVQSLERTFIDKVFALCDYYMNDDLKMHSRHIYDIYMLLPKVKFNDEFIRLIKKVREHRQKIDRCPSSASDVDITALLSQIIEKRVYEADYEDITSYFQKKKIEYNEAISSLKKIIDFSVF